MNKLGIIFGISCATIALGLTFAVSAEPEPTPVAVSEPVKTTFEINYIYTPVEGYEFVDGIMPDEIAELDDFNQAACMLAQTVYGEANGMSLYERSLVIWCILNRVDTGRFGDTIQEVITRPNQFHGYSPKKPVSEENYKLAIDVMMRWNYEKYSLGEVGRTLPKEYLYFHASNRNPGHNEYRVENHKDAQYFAFDTFNPYE